MVDDDVVVVELDVVVELLVVLDDVVVLEDVVVELLVVVLDVVVVDDPLQLVVETVARDEIESPEGLIHEKQQRIVGKCARDRDPLAHST